MEGKLLHMEEKMAVVPPLWRKFTDYVCYCYFHYTVITTVAMLEPVERYVFNSFFILLVSFIIYTTVIYLPGHLMMMFQLLLHVTGISPFVAGVGEEVDGDQQAASDGFSEPVLLVQ